MRKNYGAKVDFIRSKELSTHNSSSAEVVRRALDYFNSQGIFFDSVCLLQPTSPLRNATHIIESFQIFDKNYADSLVSVRKAYKSKKQYTCRIK